MQKDKKSIVDTHPEIAKQWHTTKNDDLSPSDISKGSNKRIWWKCERGPDHFWNSTVNNRKSDKECPICNSLASTHPDVSIQWHPTKNGELTPKDVTMGSGKSVWWKCPEGEDHIWKAPIHQRYRKNTMVKCSVCAGRTTVKSNSLQTLNPNLAKEWHPTLNGGLTPLLVGPNSTNKVWWKCDKGPDHFWIAKIGNRHQLNNGCGICSGHVIVKSVSLQTLNPEVAKEWHPTLNRDLTPLQVGLNYSKSVWWKCPKGEDHIWNESPSVRKTNRYECAVCTGRVIVKSTSLQTLYPNLAKEWHPTLNGELTPLQVSPIYSKKIWWKCPKGEDHIYSSVLNKRSVRGDGCPMCNGKTVVKSNCLETVYPSLAKEWHPTLNGGLTPRDVYSATTTKVWWKCKKGPDHIWDATIRHRTLRTQGCAVCRGLKVVKSNCLETLYPNLAKEWHPTLNGEISPEMIVPFSGMNVWWKCNKADDHEWRTKTSNRIIGGTGCPYCDLTPQSKQELIITFELKNIFKNIDPKGLKTRLEGKLRSIDIYIAKLNLALEFDGSYWHKDKKDIDKIKSEMLLKEGFKLIRIREEPLTKIYETDVISRQPYNGKQITDEILSTIMDMYDLDHKTVSRIKEYQDKVVLQNEKGLDRYIDKILTEKAEKKVNKSY
jgi:predicted RNA-binding Zn-ribbon protein involved in translation (DUF1610 family)